MNIETLGHAGLLVRDDEGEPILFTDPWVIGSCYWRSWWLQNYPCAELLEELKRVRYCYITHEHPDHFHTASIRALGKGIQILTPDLPEEHIAHYLTAQGYRASVVPALQWMSLHHGLRILSIPLFNDDSALLIDTPTAVIINLNDSKPFASQLRQLRGSLDGLLPGKTRILLSSYSPASIVNSFVRNAERISLRQKADYVRYVRNNCGLLKADYYMPFASQAIYMRSDSAWANEFKVTFADLQKYWNETPTPTQLLPPYTRLALQDCSYTFIAPERYNHPEEPVASKVQAQQALDAHADFDDADAVRLRRKLNSCRWLFAPLFPRGIDFALERTHFHYNPWSGRLRRTVIRHQGSQQMDAGGFAAGDFLIRVPGRAFKDAVENGHLADLAITMFTLVKLHSDIHPARVYLFFMLITLHDYDHTTSLRNCFKWLRRTLQIHQWRLPQESPRDEIVRV